MRIDFAIVGGGIIGCSVAYHLSKLTDESIVVFEKDFLAAGSTGLAAGVISQQLWNERDARIVFESLREFREISRISKDVGFHQVGLLRLVSTQRERKELEKRIAMQSKIGIEVIFLEPEEVLKSYPEIDVENLSGASYCKTDGYADPYEFTNFYAREAKKKNVRFFTRCEILGLHVGKERVESLILKNKEVQVKKVLLASNVWTKSLLENSKIRIPAKPYRTQVMAIKSSLKSLPMIHDISLDFYLKPHGFDIFLVGNGTETQESDAENYKEHLDEDFVEKISEKLISRIPNMRDSKFMRGWAGLCMATPDRHPLLGEHPEVERLYLALGFNGFGFMRAPAISRIVASLLLGEKPEIEVKDFLAKRFEKKEFRDFEIKQGFVL
ncbi:MAG: NAD(P)/FAD-dependent oxidoreductase [Candidatus Methanofastidiosia archaeon]